MQRMKLISAVCAAAGILLPAATVMAQSSSSYLDMLTLYGSWRAQLSAFEETVEVQDNGSRIGMRFRRTFDGYEAFARVEWGVRLVGSDLQFGGDTGSSSPFASEDNVFNARLGLIGIDFRRWGRLTVGKQWGVYYDVAGFTDLFYVFGGSASGTYFAKTDGSPTGTGRADRAITYRTTVKHIQFGVQAQLKASDARTVDTYAFSGRFDLGLVTAGLAFNQAAIPTELQSDIVGAGNNATTLIGGLRFSHARWYIAGTYSVQQNNQLAEIDSNIVAYDATGFELYALFDAARWLQLYGGINWLQPRNAPPEFVEQLDIHYYVLGAAFFFNTNTFIYASGRHDRSGSVEKLQFSVFTVGMRYDFSFANL